MTGPGYVIEFGPVAFDRWADGRPFTLIDAWRETYGVGHATIRDATGRVVLANAGSVSVRLAHIARARAASRRARGRLAGAA